MKRLYILYDAECGLCQRCRQWLARQPAYVELRFIPLQSLEVTTRFPGIERFGPREELVAVSDEGALYQGASAWIMCLYALREYREWSLRLSHPALLPLARRVCGLISENRLRLSSALFRERNETLQAEFGKEESAACDGGKCGVRTDPIDEGKKEEGRRKECAGLDGWVNFEISLHG